MSHFPQRKHIRTDITHHWWNRDVLMWAQIKNIAVFTCHITCSVFVQIMQFICILTSLICIFQCNKSVDVQEFHQSYAWQFLFNEVSGLDHRTACLGGAVGSVAVRAAWLRWSASPGSRPRLARSLCQVIAVYALRLNSRAGTEGSTVSSLIFDRWLIMGSETLSISRCLNHW